MLPHECPESLALRVEAVSHAYGARRALADVSFDVPAGAFCVLLGLNGAGKSTLFSLITRLYATRAGRIAIYGADIARASGRALARLGVVFQSRSLDADLSVRQNLVYHAALHGIGAGEACARIDETLARVGLGERIDERVSALSGGQARRVELARALLHRPRLLLLDEPTVGLDPPSRAAILGHVRALTREGVGVVWATHLLDEIAPGDRLVVLHEGRVRATGESAAIAARHGKGDLRAAFAALAADDGARAA